MIVRVFNHFEHDTVTVTDTDEVGYGTYVVLE